MLTQTEIQNLINEALEKVRYNARPDSLYAPIRYVLSMGGKRIRPVLMLMAYQLYKDDPQSILSNAIALETYHNFTLLHDDVMDKADMRRGRACVHKVWNENTAILSGDTMLILAYRLMTESRSADIETARLNTLALTTFTAATLGVCEGQQYDMEFEQRNDVSEAEYMEMIRLKTSLLLACALQIGAELAGAPKEEAAALYDFGERMGLAFQLQDDLLDVYGDSKVFGKKIGGDIVSNKKTFMLINALRLANDVQHAELMRWIQAENFDPQEKIAAVREIYDQLDIRALCQAKIETLFTQARQSLDAVKVSPTRKQPLYDFANQLLRRNS